MADASFRPTRSQTELAGVMTVAAEHVTRLLHAMDLDLDELITVEDLLAFSSRQNLPFLQEELVAMFEEANYSRDGKMDAEQLGKAVSGKFPHRRYNESWLRFFESAPRGVDTEARAPACHMLIAIRAPGHIHAPLFMERAASAWSVLRSASPSVTCQITPTHVRPGAPHGLAFCAG